MALPLARWPGVYMCACECECVRMTEGKKGAVNQNNETNLLSALTHSHTHTDLLKPSAGLISLSLHQTQTAEATITGRGR